MLQKINFLPGFNKQLTASQAESQWVSGDNVRFRYNTPEKIGGWAQLGENQITGVTRALHHIVNRSGNKFSIIGTNRIYTLTQVVCSMTYTRFEQPQIYQVVLQQTMIQMLLVLLSLVVMVL
jgi:hypothetical protein